MSENQFMAINRLPSKTWYWLKLNETHIRWQDETRPCVTLAENVRAGQADEAKFAAIRTGAGEQLESAMAGLPVTTIAGAQSETIRLRVAAGEDARQSGGVVHVQADEGQSVTVVEQIVPTGDGATALQTKLYAKKNAKICLVQLLFEGEGHTLINDVGGLCEENASIELVQLIVGEHIAVDGARVDLVGRSGKTLSMTGSSLGGGRIMVVEMNGLRANFSGDLPTLIVQNVDQPGHVSEVTSMLAHKGVNIATMQLYRDHPGGNAVMIIETDKAVPPDGLAWLERCEGITRVTFIDAEREE